MMEQEVVGMQPWQVFTAMFVGFWAISAYFDHFLLTGVFCIAFGVFGEIMTKVMYGEKISRDLEQQKEELKSLLEMVEKDDTKYEDEANVTELNKVIEQEPHAIPSEEIEDVTMDQEDEEEEEEPPPLPARDYETENIEIENMSIDNSLIDVYKVDGDAPNIEVMNEADEEAVISIENLNGNIAELDDIIIPEADHYDETIEDVQFEVNGQTEYTDAYANDDQNATVTQCESSISQNQNVSLSEPELDLCDNILGNVEVNGNELLSDSSPNIIQDVLMDIKEAVEDIYIPEESPENNCIIGQIDEDVESKNEVNLILTEISPTAEDVDQVSISNDANGEVGSNRATTEDISNENSVGCDILPLETVVCNGENQDVIEMNQGIAEEVIKQNDAQEETMISDEATSDETESSNNTNLITSGRAASDVSGNPEIDIDLTDPAVEAAATKIQSAFKGFKIRKNISKQ